MCNSVLKLENMFPLKEYILIVQTCETQTFHIKIQINYY